MSEPRSDQWMCPNCGSVNRSEDATTNACADCGRVLGTTTHVNPAEAFDPDAGTAGPKRAMEIIYAAFQVGLKLVGVLLLVLVGFYVLMLGLAFASCAFGR